MKPQEITTGALMGCVLILFGLVPGLIHGLMDRVQDLHDSILLGMRVNHPRRASRESLQPPLWLAALGGVLIALSLYGYLST